MKKLLILLFSLFFLSSPSVFADAKKEDEKKIVDAIIKESTVRAENNPGFRDLRPGIPKDLWFYIEYRGDLAKAFLEVNRPVKSTLDDF